MPETVQALAIAVVAVLPGALGVWGYERRVASGASALPTGSSGSSPPPLPFMPRSRIRLKSGRWIGGAYAPGSYASGYPELLDLYLVATAEMDQQSGDFLVNEADGLILREGTLFVSGTEIEYFEFVEA